jgi:hypothetical protein
MIVRSLEESRCEMVGCANVCFGAVDDGTKCIHLSSCDWRWEMCRDCRAVALFEEQKIPGVTNFRSFVTEFNNRLPFCDFINVGYGKERADNKLRGESQSTKT